MKQKHLYIGAASLSLLACSQQPNPALTPEDIAAQLDVHYEVVSNFDNTCESNRGDCFDARLSLTLPFDYRDAKWEIYFSHPKTIISESSEHFDITHINGDLHRLVPTSDYSGFNPGQPNVIGFQAIGQSVTKNDVMPNFIFKHDNSEALVIDSTKEVFDPQTGLWELPHVAPFSKEQQWRRTKNDNVPLASASWLYHHYASLHVEKESDLTRVIPAMRSTQWSDERLIVEQGLSFDAELTDTAAAYLIAAGLKLTKAGVTVIRKHQDMAPESYAINISDSDITLSAGDDAGWFYALQSLALLFDKKTASLPVGSAKDTPRYPFRGVHVDVARNFHDKAFLLRLIEQMGMLKLNKLHLHLAEDEAWRLAIPGLPELTEIGGYRCLDLQDKTCLLPQLGAGPDPESQVNGFFTVEDYKSVLQAAASRHIEVIPSLDMPGHSRAAIQAMEARYERLMQQEQPEAAMQYMLIDLEDTTQYSSIQHYNDNTINPCIDSSYRFIGKVLGEIKKMHDDAGVPLTRYHIGADETAGAWVESPQCQRLMQKEKIDSAQQLTAYFIHRVTKIVNDMGVMAGAWSDGLSHVEPLKLGSKIQANLWGLLPSQGHTLAHEMANYGWDAVLSLPDVLYFDFPYMTHPEEIGFYWGSRYTSTYQVFQFMPDNLPAHAALFVDHMGHDYDTTDTVPMNPDSSFAGIQAQLWSESLRHETQAEYMLFPRLVAVAERAWHKANWALPYQPGEAYTARGNQFSEQRKAAQLKDWQAFLYVLTHKIIPRLEADEVFYRLPPAGAVIDNKTLWLNAPWSTLHMEYTLDKGATWQRYQGPVNIDQDADEIGVRTYTTLSDRRSKTLWLPVTNDPKH
ncbi:family 20 glycosylhydrolase [Alteromonas sediminis]|uniref:family 20 glycosylhydrolase n=1 Tax=Alteromonas sediminis TaxID=2259342 RepID=UPI001404C598|nr:family 20 glycosylhydrolase [Alteromonas sediminis]